ncbi:MAG: TIM barrel protein [Thermoplasmata archaeon]|nr:TIM barrel protein [Thermoplasmata archaeon]
MFRFGISGIPLSSKGRMLRDAIEDTYQMGLNALEIPFFKVNVQEMDAIEDVGLYPREVIPTNKDESKIIVDILRVDEKGDYRSIGINHKIEENDIVRVLQWNLARSYGELRDLGKVAKELDLLLTVHSPNYMDLTSNDDFTSKCLDYLLWSSLIAKELDAKMVVTNLGLYGNFDPPKAMKRITDNVKKIKDRLKRQGIEMSIGFETSGKRQVAGSIEEVIDISNKIENVFPIINFPKLVARTGGMINSAEDFNKIIEKVLKFYPEHIYMQFAGLEYSPENVMRLAPIKKGDLRFEYLAEAILEHEYNSTIISVSPLLEHDAQYMRVMLERLIEKKLEKKD